MVLSSGKMSFKTWSYKDPLYVSKFGTLEPLNTKKEVDNFLKDKNIGGYDIFYI